MNRNRLSVAADLYGNNAFLISTPLFVFSRINKTDSTWFIWIYPKHRQLKAPTLKDALSVVNKQYLKYIKEEEERALYKRLTDKCLF